MCRVSVTNLGLQLNLPTYNIGASGSLGLHPDLPMKAHFQHSMQKRGGLLQRYITD
jgi:hypothetical protein